ncbi:MAG: hypothetical protein ABFD82_16030 [Syntrophaceae bacterium]
MTVHEWRFVEKEFKISQALRFNEMTELTGETPILQVVNLRDACPTSGGRFRDACPMHKMNKARLLLFFVISNSGRHLLMHRLRLGGRNDQYVDYVTFTNSPDFDF